MTADDRSAENSEVQLRPNGRPSARMAALRKADGQGSSASRFVSSFVAVFCVFTGGKVVRSDV